MSVDGLGHHNEVEQRHQQPETFGVVTSCHITSRHATTSHHTTRYVIRFVRHSLADSLYNVTGVRYFYPTIPLSVNGGFFSDITVVTAAEVLELGTYFHDNAWSIFECDRPYLRICFLRLRLQPLGSVVGRPSQSPSGLRLDFTSRTD